MNEFASPHVLAVSRQETVAALRRLKRCDVCIVGGGIHGATFAHLAAFNGLSTVLLECTDYAAETSGRSSRMAHGGLRYLEFFDLRQVFDGVRSREELYRVAPHLVHAHPFFIPVKEGALWDRVRFGIGLMVYDLFAGAFFRSRWIPKRDAIHELPVLSPLALKGVYRFDDGLLDDSRLTMERILAARQEGAVCLNHASVDQITTLGGGAAVVHWRDRVSDERYTVEAGVVVNCAGPWVSRTRGAESAFRGQALGWSRGVHLLFDQTWHGPALLFPLPGRARYYFIWPHFAGTLVGTTEHAVADPESSPVPRQEEIEELLGRLQRDLPGSGLDRSTLHHAYAGIRTIDMQGQRDRPLVRRSRRHRWVFHRGVLSLVGGKLTTAAWTALEGLRQVFKLAQIHRPVVPVSARPLPGSSQSDFEKAEFRKRCEASGVSEKAIAFCADRFGALVRLFPRQEGGEPPLGGRLIRAAVEYVIRFEQAVTVDDVMQRRFGLEYLPGHGKDSLDEVVAILQAAYPDRNVAAEREAYLKRMEQVDALCASSQQRS